MEIIVKMTICGFMRWSLRKHLELLQILIPLWKKEQWAITGCDCLLVTEHFKKCMHVSEMEECNHSVFLFLTEEGKYLEGNARISFLIDKIQEIRKIYMNLKSEVASIDRRRKKLRRREKESKLSC